MKQSHLLCTFCLLILASEPVEFASAQKVGDRVVVTANIYTKIKKQKIEKVYGGEIDTITETEGKWCALSRSKGWLPLQYVMNLDMGEDYYSKRLMKNGKDYDALAIRGMIHFEKDRYEKALKDLNQSISLNPGNPVSFNNRAIVLNATGRYQEALINLDQAIKMNPNYAAAHENRGLVLVSMGMYKPAIESFDRSIELRKDNPWAYINRGSAKSNAGDYGGAKADFLQALSMNEEISDAYVGLNVVYLAENELGKALKAANKALKKNPRNGLAYNQRGWTKYKMNKLDEALFDFDQGIRYAPKLSILFSNRGICYTDQGMYKKAIRDFNRSLILNPKAAVTLMNRGAAYMANKQYDKAIADLKRAVKLAPELTDANNAIGWFLATCSDESFRDGKKAKKHAQTACELSKWEEWSFIDTLAAAEAELGNFDAAVEMQQKAIGLAPEESRQQSLERLKLYQSSQPFRSEFGKVAKKR